MAVCKKKCFPTAAKPDYKEYGADLENNKRMSKK